MQKLTILLFIFVYGSCLSQHSNSGVCSLQNQNKNWLLDYKKAEDLDTKIDLVINKINSDAIYLDSNSEMADLDDTTVIDENPCVTGCSIRFVLIYAKTKGLVLDLKKDPILEDLISEFNAENINRIELNEYHKKDIYRSNNHNRSGVVLYTDDKELKKKVKAVVKNL